MSTRSYGYTVKWKKKSIKVRLYVKPQGKVCIKFMYPITLISAISYYSVIFNFCQYLHIGAGILSFGGDVFIF